MNFPLITIALLNYNGGEYIPLSVSSILKINYPNLEFIFVDNGSVDNSLLLLEEIDTERKFKIIKNKHNFGYSVGKNQCAQESTGDFILLLDVDIVLEDCNIISKLLNIYISNKDQRNIAFLQVPLVDIGRFDTKYYGIFYSIYGDNSHKESYNIKDITKIPKLLQIVGPCGAFVFVKKSDWLCIGGYDEIQLFNLDDIDIGPRSMILGYGNFLYTGSSALHLGVNKTVTAESYSKRFKTLFSGHARSMFKNYKAINLIILFPIFFLFHLFKAIRFSIKKKSFLVFKSFIISVLIFIKNLPDTLRKRSEIQKMRIVSSDNFLYVIPPKF